MTELERLEGFIKEYSLLCDKYDLWMASGDDEDPYIHDKGRHMPDFAMIGNDKFDFENRGFTLKWIKR